MKLYRSRQCDHPGNTLEGATGTDYSPSAGYIKQEPTQSPFQGTHIRNGNMRCGADRSDGVGG